MGRLFVSILEPVSAQQTLTQILFVQASDLCEICIYVWGRSMCRLTGERLVTESRAFNDAAVVWVSFQVPKFQ